MKLIYRRSGAPIFWLGVQPSPYNWHLLQNLKSGAGVPVKVYFSQQVFLGLPWKKNWFAEDDCFFKKHLGIDWSLVSSAVLRRDSLFVVVGWNDPTKIVVILVRRLLGAPLAVWTDTVRAPTARQADRIKTFILKWVMSGNTVAFTTGEVGVAAFLTAGYATKRSRVVNLPFYVPIPAQCIMKKELTNVNFLIGARLVPRKGIEIAIEGVRRCVALGISNVHLFIAGTGPESARLMSQVEESGIERFVTFLGWIESDMMTEVFKRANVLVHVVPEPDPFPVIVLEAMASGLAIIATPLAGSAMERVVEEKSGLFVRPGDAEDVAKAMAIFCSNPLLAAEMGAQARRCAEDWPVERGVATVRNIMLELSEAECRL
jgi:glycosyltransferase involved in cell wall biosynthesis